VFRAILFDAAGTLFQLNGTVGAHYALVGREVGLDLDADKLNDAFLSAWNKMPSRPAIDGPRADDDKGWWQVLVGLVFAQAYPGVAELDRDNFFEVAYEHFAEAGVWELYPDVLETLEELRPRVQLAVVSNFDGRLRMILEQLAISKFFSYVFVSSEVGADKPDPEIFRRAVRYMKLEPKQVLHVGDDPERDWKAAETAGLAVFRLQRPQNSLRDVPRVC
jgi:putative hydrolase of the HAD superfamily